MLGKGIECFDKTSALVKAQEDNNSSSSIVPNILLAIIGIGSVSAWLYDKLSTYFSNKEKEDIANQLKTLQEQINPKLQKAYLAYTKEFSKITKLGSNILKVLTANRLDIPNKPKDDNTFLQITAKELQRFITSHSSKAYTKKLPTIINNNWYCPIDTISFNMDWDDAFAYMENNKSVDDDTDLAKQYLKHINAFNSSNKILYAEWLPEDAIKELNTNGAESWMFEDGIDILVNTGLTKSDIKVIYDLIEKYDKTK